MPISFMPTSGRDARVPGRMVRGMEPRVDCLNQPTEEPPGKSSRTDFRQRNKDSDVSDSALHRAIPIVSMQQSMQDNTAASTGAMMRVRTGRGYRLILDSGEEAAILRK